jgi:hypothetical protein
MISFLLLHSTDDDPFSLKKHYIAKEHYRKSQGLG